MLERLGLSGIVPAEVFRQCVRGTGSGDLRSSVESNEKNTRALLVGLFDQVDGSDSTRIGLKRVGFFGRPAALDAAATAAALR